MNDQLRKIPNHIAIIMDGNGRWAKAKGKKQKYTRAYSVPAKEGHMCIQPPWNSGEIHIWNK